MTKDAMLGLMVLAYNNGKDLHSCGACMETILDAQIEAGMLPPGKKVSLQINTVVNEWDDETRPLEEKQYPIIPEGSL